MKYEAVIGLEVHVQIKAKSKMFTSVATGFGAPENSLVDPVIMALPGTLPVMNKVALDRIIKAGLMLDCAIAPVCKWDRKNYFYPDSPKNYQISQYDQPICIGGRVEIELPGESRNVMGEHKFIPLTRIHLEEDVGKLNHHESDSLVDYNRAGTPLMEIVSDPAMHTPDEAFAFLTTLKTIMVYGGISDCDMEKGQMRCDANISIRPVGQTELGTKVELKNLNSISFVKAGIAHEIKRQIGVLESGGSLVQETRQFDGEKGYSVSMRSKEMAHDYRYFPDPDLMPVVVDDAWKSSIQSDCPELPFAKQRRFQADFGLPYTLTSVLVPDRELSGYFEAVVTAGAEPQAAANIIVNDLLRELSAAGQSLIDCQVTPTKLAGLLMLVSKGGLLKNLGREVLAEMFTTGADAASIVEKRGLGAATNTDELETWCREAIEGNPKALADFQGGKESAINGFKGHVMRCSKGKADPRQVDQTLRRLLAAL